MKKSLIALLFLVASLPLAAQERNVHITVFYSQADMQGDNDFGGGFVTDFDQGSGYGASANIFFGRHFSAEAAAFSLRADSALVFEDAAAFDLGSLNLTTMSLGAQYHVLGSSRFDPYVGAGAAYVLGDDFVTSDLEFAGVGRIELDNQLTYYFNAGIAFQITEGFGIVIDGRQLSYVPSTRSSVTGVEQDLDISPRILSAGVRLRF